MKADLKNKDKMINGNSIGKGIGFPAKWLQILCIAAAFVAMPVYIVARLLFKIAIVRDNTIRFPENPAVRYIFDSAYQTIRTVKNNKRPDAAEEQGKGFDCFKREIESGKTWFLSQNRDRITVTSYDGLKLVAYYLPAANESDKVMILMHGYRNDGFGDFSGLVEYYHSMGYHLLVPHQRSHGESEGTYICYGVKERYDLKQWTEYIVNRFDGNCSVYLSGISMGGATVLMAAGLELPVQVKGIIADCAFTSPWDIFAHVIKKDYNLPKFPFLYAADYISGKRAGFRFKECSTVSCMKRNKIPVLFIHGGRDTFVPTEMGYKNYEACAAPKEILIVDQAAHGTSNLVEPEVYRRTVIEFMEKWSDGN
mgnify:CR=1 FL=1